MPQYFFDVRDNDRLLVDEEGVELPTIEAVQVEAARSLVDMTKYVAWTKADSITGHPMAIEVRDETGPVLQAKFTFEPGRPKLHS